MRVTGGNGKLTIHDLTPTQYALIAASVQTAIRYTPGFEDDMTALSGKLRSELDRLNKKINRRR
jgi:hypothetical protein